jgi:1-acyl-sn-glycerol-3-phosphate acyltransferase
MKKRYNYWYWLAGKWIKCGVDVYFRRRVTKGIENVPYDKPIIFAPNHQNAFMDAFCCVLPVNIKKQTGFMVRADVFKGNLANKLLRSLKMFPAYRMRDGIENLSKNEQAFAEAYELLEYNEGLIIFPEANHALPRSLRPLKKGICRSAFGAEVKNNWELDVHIVPVGMNYSDQENFGGECLVNYGKPIRLSEYRKLFEESPGKANKELIEEIADRLRPLIIDIQNQEMLKSIEFLREIDLNNGVGRKAPLEEKFKLYKESITKWEDFFNTNPDRVEELREKVESYKKELRKHNLLDHLIGSIPKGMAYFALNYLFLLILSPLFVISALIHALPFWYPVKMAKKVKDVGFRSSIKVAVGMLMFLLLYLLLTVVGMFVLPAWWWAFGIPIALGIIGLSGLVWLRKWNKTTHLWRYSSLKKQGKLKVAESLRRDIINAI